MALTLSLLKVAREFSYNCFFVVVIPLDVIMEGHIGYLMALVDFFKIANSF